MAEIEDYTGTRQFLQAALLDHEWEPGRPLSVHRMHKYDGRCAICLGDVASMVVVLLGAIEAHPTQTVRHYAPTQWAYDQACKALEKHRTRANEAEEKIRQIERIRCWTNEDGKRFMFVEDLVPILSGQAAVSASEGEAEDA